MQSQRNAVHGAVKLALERKLGITFKISSETQIAALKDGCSLSVCSVAHLIMNGNDSTMLSLLQNPTAAQNAQQYTCLTHVKNLITATNP
jgi:hypothetical protein